MARKGSSRNELRRQLRSILRKRESRQGCQRLGEWRPPWDDNAHALVRMHQTWCGGLEARQKRGQLPSAEASTSVVKHSVPRKPHGAQDSVGCPRDESRGANRERTRYGCTQIVQVAEVGRTHRASCPPEGRKALWRARALAGRKLEALPDAGHEPVEGETVRGKALTIKSTRWFGLWVSARRFSIRRKVFSGFCPSCLYRQGEAGSFGSKVNLSPYHPRGA
jgi:hypothetical protein